MRISRHCVAFPDGPHVTATDIDTNAHLLGAQTHRGHTGEILSQSQRGSAGEKAIRLTVALVNNHARHTSIRLRGGDKLHAQGVTQTVLTLNDAFNPLDIHSL